MSIKSYDFSYTGFSLRPNEMYKVALSEHVGEPIDIINDLGGGKEATGKKFFNEITKRLKVLTSEQLQLLIDGDMVTRKQMAFLSMCKKHLFIRDVVVELLREKYLVFDTQLTEGEYNAFIRQKAEIHPEIDQMKESSFKKIKQVTIRILVEAGILNNSNERIIEPQILDGSMRRALINDNPDWLKVFLVSDFDIESSN